MFISCLLSSINFKQSVVADQIADRPFNIERPHFILGTAQQLTVSSSDTLHHHLNIHSEKEKIYNDYVYCVTAWMEKIQHN